MERSYDGRAAPWLHMSYSKRPPVIALIVLGLLTIATGVYFMVLRPAVLPEDLRFMSLAPSEVAAPVRSWIAVVFRTWGGFMIGLGLCVLGHAMSMVAGNARWSRLRMAAGLVFAFGSFLASNVQLRSDFLWFISLMFVVATACTVLLVAARDDTW